MTRALLQCLTLCVLLAGSSMPRIALHAGEPAWGKHVDEFYDHSGARLVFVRDDLPEGRYHDVLKPLDVRRRARAAEICVKEAKKFPRNYLRDVGLLAVGVFDACASKTTSDPGRVFDKQLGGYRYFGIYNGRNAVAAAFYSEEQLSLTFHHEVFHHVDSTVNGVTEAWQLSSDDAFYRGAVDGLKPYAPPEINGRDLKELKKRRIGFLLKDSVSEYAAKNSREDQAETARHLMSMLPSSLIQAVRRPDLAGSQRIIHVLKEYERSVPDGPSVDWFVDVALGRIDHEQLPEDAGELLDRLREITGAQKVAGATSRPDQPAVRRLLRAVYRCDSAPLNELQRSELLRLSGRATELILISRITNPAAKGEFEVWGEEDSDGVNHTLRSDLARVGRDAKRLNLIVLKHARNDSEQGSKEMKEVLIRTHSRALRLIAEYYEFIGKYWQITSGTESAFQSLRNTLLDSIDPASEAVVAKLNGLNWTKLARTIPENGISADTLAP